MLCRWRKKGISYASIAKRLNRSVGACVSHTYKTKVRKKNMRRQKGGRLPKSIHNPARHSQKGDQNELERQCSSSQPPTTQPSLLVPSGSMGDNLDAKGLQVPAPIVGLEHAAKPWVKAEKIIDMDLVISSGSEGLQQPYHSNDTFYRGVIRQDSSFTARLPSVVLKSYWSNGTFRAE